MELTSVKTIRSIQDKFGFTFKKGLGQNFLTSRDVLLKIVEAADAKDGVIEVGPGFGVLTQELARSSQKVVTIELDDRLLEVLDYTLAEFDNVLVVHGDILKTDIEKLIEEEFGGKEISIAANLPYYITTPIIAKLLEDKLPIKNIVVMIQKEVADRICAKPGSKDFGAISVMCQYYAKPEIVTIAKAGMFCPPPKVDSAVLKLKMLDEPSVRVKDEKLFFKTVKAAFSQRRKTLLNCLASSFNLTKDKLTKILLSVDISPQRRGETLSLEEFRALSDAIFEEGNKDEI